MLSLLPTIYRRNLLFELPPADICSLQDTSFAEGIDFNKIWESIFYSTVFKAEIDNSHEEMDWRSQYLDKIFQFSLYGKGSISPRCEIHRSNRYLLLNYLFGIPLNRTPLVIPATSRVVTICDVCGVCAPLRYAFLYHLEQQFNMRTVFEIINYLLLYFQYHPSTLQISNCLFHEKDISDVPAGIPIPTFVKTANKYSNNLKEYFNQLKHVQLSGLPRKLHKDTIYADVSSMYIIDKLIHNQWKCIESLEILPLSREMSTMIHELIPCVGSKGMPSLRNLSLSIDDTVCSSQLLRLAPVGVLSKLDLYVKVLLWSEGIEHNILIMNQKALSGSIYIDLTDVLTEEFLKIKPFLKQKLNTKVHFIIKFKEEEFIDSGVSSILHSMLVIDGYLNAKLDKSVILKQTFSDKQSMFFELPLAPIEVQKLIIKNDVNVKLLIILNIKFEFLELHRGLTSEDNDCLMNVLCHCSQEQLIDLKIILNYSTEIPISPLTPFNDKDLVSHLITTWRLSPNHYKFKSITVIFHPKYITDTEECLLMESQLKQISEKVQITPRWRRSASN